MVQILVIQRPVKRPLTMTISGSRDDLVLVLENLTYFTPFDYSGPELITVSVERDGVHVTASLLLYVTGTCL